jgi:hypothetical protein
VQSRNALFPIFETLLDIFIFDNCDIEIPKLFIPRSIADCGIVIDVNFKQFSNIDVPILETAFGIMIDDKLEQFKNAPLPIFVTLLDIIIFVNLDTINPKY